MPRWTIAKRIGSGFALIVVIALILGGAGFYSAWSNQREIQQLGSRRLPAVEHLQNIKIGGERIYAAQQALLQWNLDADARAREYASIDEIRNSYEASWKIYAALPKKRPTRGNCGTTCRAPGRNGAPKTPKPSG